MSELILPAGYTNVINVSTITPRQALEILDLEITQLKTITKEEYVTSGISQSFVVKGKAFDLKSCQDTGLITKFLGSIMGKAHWYNQAQDQLKGIDVPEFTYEGYPLSLWIQDCQLRIGWLIQQPLLESKKEEYKVLSTFISEKDKEQKALESFIANRTKK